MFSQEKFNMSSEKIIKALERLGLSRVEAEVYFYIANKGPQKAINMAYALNVSKSKFYVILRNLLDKGLVSKDHTNYSALPFEKALELLITREKKQARHILESKKQLLASWKKEK